MSRVNGEKARANIARRNRTARRVKDRARMEVTRQATEEKKPSEAEQPAKK
jgi:hypothetical protein